jgi:hypothetical protein
VSEWPINYVRCSICDELVRTRIRPRVTCGRPACQLEHKRRHAKEVMRDPGEREKRRARFRRWYERNRAKVLARVARNAAERKAASS